MCLLISMKYDHNMFGGKTTAAFTLPLNHNPFPLLLNHPQILKNLGSISHFGKFVVGQFDF